MHLGDIRTGGESPPTPGWVLRGRGEGKTASGKDREKGDLEQRDWALPLHSTLLPGKSNSLY